MPIADWYTGVPQEYLREGGTREPKKKRGMTREEIAKMELEMETIERDLKAVEESYGENMLNLNVARGYIKRLLENPKVVKFLAGNYREILSEFQSIARAWRLPRLGPFERAEDEGILLNEKHC